MSRFLGKLYLNGSLYDALGRVRYLEPTLVGGKRFYSLAAVTLDADLRQVLELASDGLTVNDFVLELENENTPRESIESILQELVDAHVLLRDDMPAVTGRGMTDQVLAALEVHHDSPKEALALSHIANRLRVYDGSALGDGLSLLRECGGDALALPSTSRPEHALQVDLCKPAERMVLAEEHIRELLDVLDLLGAVPDRQADHPDLASFVTRFRERFEDREIPLLEALDEDIGVGYAGHGLDTPVQYELSDGVPFETVADSPRWSPIDRERLEILLQAERQGRRDLDVRPLLENWRARQPSAQESQCFGVLGALGFESKAALDSGQYELVLVGTLGPSGAVMLGRFADMDEDLLAAIRRHSREEEQLDPDKVFAEIVHIPTDRVANVTARPLFRDYEIPIACRSGAASSQQIQLRDLTVSVRKGRVLLRSRKLGREVVPRLTSAHNFEYGRNLHVYRFLCRLQRPTSLPHWSWGSLEAVHHLPRLRCGRVVICPESWSLPQSEHEDFFRTALSSRVDWLRRWHSLNRLPRFVYVGEEDLLLLVDFENSLSVKAAADKMERNRPVRFTEMIPAPENLAASGPEGRFVNQFVVPVRRRATTPTRDSSRPRAALRQHVGFPPKSRWIYVKGYGSVRSVDDFVLQDLIQLVSALATTYGQVEWFFVRYQDPGNHIRLRLSHESPSALIGVEKAVMEHFSRLYVDGRFSRIQLDTYEPEIERYGGNDAFALVEKIFTADSQAVVEALHSGGHIRWQLALYGVYRLLQDFGYDRESLLQYAGEQLAQIGRVAGADAGSRHALSERYRARRGHIESLLANGPEAPALATIFSRRSDAIRSLVGRLRTMESAGTLMRQISDIAGSLVHMHLNRVLTSPSYREEYATYDALFRWAKSVVARQTQGGMRLVSEIEA